MICRLRKTLCEFRGITKDLAGNGNSGSSIVSVQHDNSRPAVASLTSTSASPTSSTPITCLATFSEPVLQFTGDDVMIKGSNTKLISKLKNLQ